MAGHGHYRANAQYVANAALIDPSGNRRSALVVANLQGPDFREEATGFIYIGRGQKIWVRVDFPGTCASIGDVFVLMQNNRGPFPQKQPQVALPGTVVIAETSGDGGITGKPGPCNLSALRLG